MLRYKVILPRGHPTRSPAGDRQRLLPRTVLDYPSRSKVMFGWWMAPYQSLTNIESGELCAVRITNTHRVNIFLRSSASQRAQPNAS